MSDEQRVSFDGLIGKEILVVSDLLSKEPKKLKKVTLRGVDPHGIWIESPELNQSLLKAVGALGAPKTLVYFLPFRELKFAISSIDLPNILESEAGL